MSAVSSFAFPFNQGASAHVPGPSGPARPKKRKRVESEEEAVSGGDDASSALSDSGSSPPPPTSPAASKKASSGSVNIHLSLIVESGHPNAEQDLHDDLQMGHFPHTPSSSKIEESRKDSRLRIAEELATLNPPLYHADGSFPRVGLRQRHIAVLTAILHRSLLENDYVRAGRAWGMLLRAEMHGKSMDVRTRERWGIGAEVLLRRDAQLAQRKRVSERKKDSSETGPEDLNINLRSKDTRIGLSTKLGFDQAREYYERLILLYPPLKSFPNAITALDFYPAMFALWIYAVQEQHRVELDRTLAPNTVEEDSSSVRYSSSPSNEERSSATAEEVRVLILGQAQEISTRLDELLISPHYSDESTLRNLQDMIALWIIDLSVPTKPSSHNDEGSSDTG